MEVIPYRTRNQKALSGAEHADLRIGKKRISSSALSPSSTMCRMKTGTFDQYMKDIDAFYDRVLEKNG